jgi:hypothetical protein
MNFIFLIYFLNFNGFKTELKNINSILKPVIEIGDSSIPNPVKWRLLSKKLNDKEFEITYSATIEKEWFLIAEGDSSGFIPLTFSFKNKKNIKTDGNPKSLNQRIAMAENVTEGFGKLQLGYQSSVDFQQIIKVIDTDKPAKFNIIFDYQCATNEILAVPPIEKEFSFEIKKGKLIVLK